MERINREMYLNALIDKRENGLIKIISGIRSYYTLYIFIFLYKKTLA